MSLAAALSLLKADDTTSEQFDQISTIGLKTTRAVSGRDLDEPKELIISHELSKDRSRTNSVVIVDETKSVGTETISIGGCRVRVKVSYDNSIMTADEVKDVIHQACDFFATSDNVTRFLNREH
jgi:hypothetical protein